ncbi:putative phage gp36 major capsid-like protein [Amorphus orientalis]|uniref:Phage gp36 major capsid-like protein n=1 Tax=Amorphus orientalis TaxID=649198 RepID=A0AAE3VU47_9HYPH|nr:putative phage gp36 major capsid-like protein [Amorphus orientalis]
MSETNHMAFETKAAPGDGDLGAAFADFMGAFEVFKETNDRRLDELERRSATDVVTLEKLDRVDRALDAHRARVDDLVLKARRPALGGDGAAFRSGAALEHKAAFEAYVRSGRDHDLKALELKALTAASDDAGYLVPEEVDREIGRRLAAISPIRSIAGVRQVSGTSFKKPFAISGPATGWVGETDARTTTDAPVLKELTFRRWSFTPCRRPPRRCSTTPRSISASGWRRRSTRRSRSRRARRSSQARARPSPPASCSTTPWRKAPGNGASSATWRPVRTARSRARTRAMR